MGGGHRQESNKTSRTETTQAQRELNRGEIAASYGQVGVLRDDGPSSTNDISSNTQSIHHKPGHIIRLEVLSQDTDRGYCGLPDGRAWRARLALAPYEQNGELAGLAQLTRIDRALTMARGTTARTGRVAMNSSTAASRAYALLAQHVYCGVGSCGERPA
jgi:hypothetical protein